MGIQRCRYNVAYNYIYRMHSILLRRMSQSLLRFGVQARFSQAPPQKKNIFRLPLKHEFPVAALQITQQYILSARSCNVLAVTFRDNISLFTQLHLKLLYQHLRNYKLEIDNSFHQIIAPISLEYLKVFNREQATVMYTMMMTMLELQIDNTPLWEALLNKLDNENCYRYIPLYETSLLLNELLNCKESSKGSLVRKLIGVVYQNKQFYNYHQITRPVLQEILTKLEKLQSEDPQLTEAFKQLK